MSSARAEVTKGSAVGTARLPARSRSSSAGDRWFAGGTRVMATSSVVVFAALVALLLVYATPALQRFGVSFFTTTTWDPVFLTFGAAHFIYGTLVTSLVGLLIATPIAIGAALYVAEYAPEWLREPVSFIIELLAVIPSIIYGLWGVLRPGALHAVVCRARAPGHHRTDPRYRRPVLRSRSGQGHAGRGRDPGDHDPARLSWPSRARSSAQFLTLSARACWRWARPSGRRSARPSCPYARGGHRRAAVLGLARALGETMAVTMVIGNSSKPVNASLFTPGYTMASAIANQFNEADKEIYFSAIVAVARAAADRRHGREHRWPVCCVARFASGAWARKRGLGNRTMANQRTRITPDAIGSRLRSPARAIVNYARHGAHHLAALAASAASCSSFWATSSVRAAGAEPGILHRASASRSVRRAAALRRRSWARCSCCWWLP